MNRNWLYVILAGVVEILWVTGLKHSNAWYEWTATLLLIGLSFFLLIQATKTLPVATVYAVFTGIGTAGTVVVDILAFGEPFSWTKVLFIALLLIGVLGLKLVTNEKEEGAA